MPPTGKKKANARVPRTACAVMRARPRFSNCEMSKFPPFPPKPPEPKGFEEPEPEPEPEFELLEPELLEPSPPLLEKGLPLPPPKPDGRPCANAVVAGHGINACFPLSDAGDLPTASSKPTR